MPFVTGLPDGVRQVLRAGANINEMKLETILKRARAMLSDKGIGLACGVVTASGEGKKEERVEEVCASVVRPVTHSKDEVRGSQRGCFKRGESHHFARHCWMTTRERLGVKFFKCDEVGHVAAKCPVGKPASLTGNESRKWELAPARFWVE